MRTIVRMISAVGALAALIGTAVAADLTGPEIKTLLYGKTVYLETSTGTVSGQTGQGVIYWAEDGTALYKTPNGSMLHGKSEIKGDTNCKTPQRVPARDLAVEQPTNSIW
jgi:hypothetical protein